MGRTVLPFSQVLAEHQQRLTKFRRTLRKEDQRALDALFEQARLHIQAAVYAASPDPTEAFFLSILVENWKKLDRLESRVAEVERYLRLRESENLEAERSSVWPGK
jgi:uncharacterized coiled-coil protein SlyX